MRKITAMDAENKTREFVGERYPRLKGIHFARTRSEDNVRAL